MEWSPAFFLNSALLGVGLAMDAFSVSMANGLAEPRMGRGKMALIAGTFAFFQALMPMTGYLCVNTLVSWFSALQRFVPWIALVLLLYIGGKMLWDGTRHRGEGETGTAGRLTLAALLLQGIATSIDALSVGFTLAEYGPGMALVCSLVIAAVTLAICLGGVLIGRRFGTRLAGRAAILGGAILIFIGIEIFIRGIV